MKISIITVCLNSEKTIVKSIESVLSQTSSFEYVIIDGKSSDKTMSIVNNYSKYINKIISKKDNGIYYAMNNGIKECSGEIIGFINSDDFYSSPYALSSVARTFFTTGCEACYADLVYVDERHRPIRYWKSGDFSTKKFYSGWMPPHPTFFVKKRIFERYGVFDTSLGTAADYELMLRFLVRHSISCAYIPRVLVCMRTGGASNGKIRNRINAHDHDRLAWKKNGLSPHPHTLISKPLRKVSQYVTQLRSSANVPCA